MQYQIERAVVVEVGNVQPNTIRKIVSYVWNSRDFGGLPAFSLVLVRDSQDRAIGLDGQQIENSVIVRVRNGDCFHGPTFAGKGRSRNCPWRSFMKTCR